MSELQAIQLIQKEKQGRARKGVIEFLAVQARKAARIELDQIRCAKAQARKAEREARMYARQQALRVESVRIQQERVHRVNQARARQAARKAWEDRRRMQREVADHKIRQDARHALMTSQTRQERFALNARTSMYPPTAPHAQPAPFLQRLPLEPGVPPPTLATLPPTSPMPILLDPNVRARWPRIVVASRIHNNS